MRIPLEPVIDVHSHTLDIFIDSAAIHVQISILRAGLWFPSFALRVDGLYQDLDASVLQSLKPVPS